jgi:hypothetical protein
MLRSRWLPLTLVVCLVGSLGYSLSESEWVERGLRAAPVNGLWLGLACGLALAASRFRGQGALAYSLFVSIAIAGESIGHVLPSPAILFTDLQSLIATPPTRDMHVRLLTLFDRMSGWATAYAGGEAIQDAGLFVFVLVLVLWNAGAWLAWCVFRRRRTLAGLWPLGALLAVNVHLSDQPVMNLAFFLACALLLLAGMAYDHEHADWVMRRVDYPDDLGLTWAGTAALITAAIGLLVLLAPSVGTPAGWKALSDLVRFSRLHTANTAERLFAAVNPPPAVQPAVLARTPDLQAIGAPVPQGSATVMWVILSDPPPPPPEMQTTAAPAPPRHYWRSAAFATYTGAGWEPLAWFDAAQEPTDVEAPPAGRYALRQHFEIVALHMDTLFAVNVPLTASEGVQREVGCPPAAEAGCLDAQLRGATSTYDVVSWATDVTAEQLAAAPTDYPGEIASAYLQLPASLPQRVRSLADRLTDGAATPYAKAIRIQDYLRATYPYRLDVPRPLEGRDAVDYFLFDAPGGFCTYYASAMAVMLRAEDVPARVAVGYATGDYDFTHGAYRVPADAAHAWVEVYFPGYGWVEFEPTSARSRFDYGVEAGPAPTLPVTPGPALSAGQGSSWSIPLWAGGLIGLLSLLGAVWWLRRPGHDAPARELYQGVRRALAQAGLRAEPSVTPDEYLAAYKPALASARPALFEALARATSLYLKATFSPHPVSEAEAQTARALWRRALPDWLKQLIAHGLSRIA